MGNISKNYSFNTERNVRISTEIVRLRALLGNSPLDFDESNNSGSIAETFQLRTGLFGLNFMVLQEGANYEFALLQPEAFELIRTPQISRLFSYNVAALITSLKEDMEVKHSPKITREHARDLILIPHVPLEVGKVATAFSDWLLLETKNTDAKTFDQTGYHVIGQWSPSKLLSLCALSVMLGTYKSMDVWPWTSRHIWEELKRLSSNEMAFVDMHRNLAPTYNIYQGGKSSSVETLDGRKLIATDPFRKISTI